MGEACQFRARHVDIDQHPRNGIRRHRHRLGGKIEIEVMIGDEMVDHVEIGGGDAVHRVDAALFDHKTGLRIAGTLEGGKAVLRVLHGKAVEPQRPLVPIHEAPPPIGTGVSTGIATGISCLAS